MTLDFENRETLDARWVDGRGITADVSGAWVIRTIEELVSSTVTLFSRITVAKVMFRRTVR